MSSAVELQIAGREAPLGGFTVRRVLPFRHRRSVGPFVFFDHMGPVEFQAGHGMDVLPHPHIGLATVTYLFEGSAVHRDSLGLVQPIRPGDVNWMTAGRGIVHSERTGPEERARGGRLHGVQTWVALPHEAEEADPDFQHVPGGELPSFEVGGSAVRLVLGRVHGRQSPVRAASEMFYLEARIPQGAALPVPEEHEERAVYVVDGLVRAGGEEVAAGVMAVLRPGVKMGVEAVSAAHVLLLGGAPLDGPRHIWWNFVSSSVERIERAKRDWAEGRFPPIPGETEFVPLPRTELRLRPLG
jgi:redox-sensitive bicupin YhaK (pirin superfamily)